ncbi:MAG: antitoxin [Kineosporiaceae bacterium]
MRTTLTLDDDIARVARQLARAQHRSLGQIVSELARRGLAPNRRFDDGPGGFPVVRSTAASRPITADDVADALDEP